MQSITIAIVADDPNRRQQMRDVLGEAGFAILEYDSRMVTNLGGINGAYTVCIDVDGTPGLELLQRWATNEPEVPVVVCGPESVQSVALERGAYDFVPVTSVSARLAVEVKHAVEKRQLSDTVKQLRTELTRRDHGDGDAVVPLRELERRAIGRALQATNGSVTKAAKLLGIGRATLYRRLASPELAGLRPRRGYDTHAHAAVAQA